MLTAFEPQVLEGKSDKKDTEVYVEKDNWLIENYCNRKLETYSRILNRTLLVVIRFYRNNEELHLI